MSGNINIVVVYDNNEKEGMHSKDLADAGLNRHKGWECSAGITSLAIYPEGDMYTAVCKNDYIGNINEDFKLPEQNTICKTNVCSCSFDITYTSKKRI